MQAWLDQADGVLAIPIHPAEPQHIRDTLVKVQVRPGASTPGPECLGSSQAMFAFYTTVQKFWGRTDIS